MITRPRQGVEWGPKVGGQGTGMVRRRGLFCLVVVVRTDDCLMLCRVLTQLGLVDNGGNGVGGYGTMGLGDRQPTRGQRMKLWRRGKYSRLGTTRVVQESIVRLELKVECTAVEDSFRVQCSVGG